MNSHAFSALLLVAALTLLGGAVRGAGLPAYSGAGCAAVDDFLPTRFG